MDSAELLEQLADIHLPGPVRDLAVDDRYLWVATGGGLVRFDKRAVR